MVAEYPILNETITTMLILYQLEILLKILNILPILMFPLFSAKYYITFENNL